MSRGMVLVSAVLLACAATLAAGALRLRAAAATLREAQAGLDEWSGLEIDLAARRARAAASGLAGSPPADLSVGVLAAVRAAGLADDTIAEVTPQESTVIRGDSGDPLRLGVAWHRQITMVRVKPLELSELGLLFAGVRAELPHLRTLQIELSTSARPTDQSARYAAIVRLGALTLEPH